MKKLIPITYIAFLSVLGCINDSILEEINDEDNPVASSEIETNCISVNLIAGQFHNAGTIEEGVNEDNLVIKYVTNEDWIIKATHLSISDCSEGSIPINGAGNPRIGNFEYQTTHDNGVTEVVYTISREENTQDMYCFAAHAEVIGPTGEETAWGEGLDFGGSSWAMFVKTALTECDEDDNNDDGGNVS